MTSVKAFAEAILALVTSNRMPNRRCELIEAFVREELAKNHQDDEPVVAPQPVGGGILPGPEADASQAKPSGPRGENLSAMMSRAPVGVAASTAAPESVPIAAPEPPLPPDAPPLAEGAEAEVISIKE